MTASATQAQLRVLDALRQVTQDGWPATVREVAAVVNGSVANVHRLLKTLEADGLAVQHPRSPAGGWKVSEAAASAAVAQVNRPELS